LGGRTLAVLGGAITNATLPMRSAGVGNWPIAPKTDALTTGPLPDQCCRRTVIQGFREGIQNPYSTESIRQCLHLSYASPPNGRSTSAAGWPGRFTANGTVQRHGRARPQHGYSDNSAIRAGARPLRTTVRVAAKRGWRLLVADRHTLNAMKRIKSRIAALG